MTSQGLVLVLNAVGLVLNTAGAFTIWWFGSPPLRITPDGGNLDVWVATPPEPQRTANLERYRRHRKFGVLGLLGIAVGFLCQLVALGIASCVPSA